MKDLEVTMTIRNNRIKARRIDLGMSQVTLARVCGISIGRVNGLECMRHNPLTPGGDWSPSALALARFFECDPSDLFPPIASSGINPRAVKHVDADCLPALMESRAREIADSPHHATERSQFFGLLLGYLKERASPRDFEIFCSYHGLGGRPEQTLRELGEEHGVTGSRVNDILHRLTRIMRQHGYRMKHTEERETMDL